MHTNFFKPTAPTAETTFTRTSEKQLDAFLKSTTYFKLCWAPGTNLVYVKRTFAGSGGVDSLLCQLHKSPRGLALRITQFKLPAQLADDHMVEPYATRYTFNGVADKRSYLELLLTRAFQKTDPHARAKKQAPHFATTPSLTERGATDAEGALVQSLLARIEHLELRTEGLVKRVTQLEGGQMRF